MDSLFYLLPFPLGGSLIPINKNYFAGRRFLSSILYLFGYKKNINITTIKKNQFAIRANSLRDWGGQETPLQVFFFFSIVYTFMPM